MPNKMLIDATHAEETRVVVLRGNRVEEFDFESASRKQLRGNIYLAKVTRVEPSLQAAFVDYGGNRHGFLAFSEIHPDYYQIPVADRQQLIDEEERAQRAADAEADKRARRRGPARGRNADHADDVRRSEVIEATAGEYETDHAADEAAPPEQSLQAALPVAGDAQPTDTQHAADALAATASESEAAEEHPVEFAGEAESHGEPVETTANGAADGETEEEVVESVGGADAMEEVPERMPRTRRQYKIQEVIKRRQVMLVQVVKEERGTKGAALTTYLSLAGRYSVLMPNTARGGGISRKITSAPDRQRLKDVVQDLEVPEGMGVILRTAGANRTKTEIKRDFEYLLRMWETVRDLTLKSTAPKLVYEEGSLIKRSIRDLYNKDIDEVIVAGEQGYQEAKDFMRMLMPSHAKHVKLYKDPQPLLSRYGVENQLDAMFTPVVQLRSGGYIVLNQTEALVSIDVNSGRATREHHIEDTALKTNLEAADEIARQLRLRDLAGLIVIDFIDMDEKRNNRAVERRLKDCLKHDRARIQVGRISHFGLLEMSRQRIRSSVLESSTEKCPHCGGTGHMRSVSSVSLQVLRALEDTLIKGATHNILVRTRAEVALYLLNHKRAHLRELEQRFRITITIDADATVGALQPFVIDRGEQVHSVEAAKAIAAQPEIVTPHAEQEAEEEEGAEAEAAADDEDEEGEDETVGEAADGQPAEFAPGEAGARRRRRRRRRGRRGGAGRDGEGYAHDDVATQPQPRGEAIEGEHAEDEGAEAMLGMGAAGAHGAGESRGDGERHRRRRGRRGGRRSRRGRDGRPETPHLDTAAGTEPELDRAVASLDTSAAPPPEPQPFMPRAGEPVAAEPEIRRPEPEPRQAEAASSAEIAPEPPRRRSTVREPAPIVGGDWAPPAPSPAPAPAAAPESSSAAESTEAEDADKPRRSGWWSRRFAGGS
jgi:ribonuclease E